MADDTPSEKPEHLGHRDRLRQRFSAAPESMPDYELLELLLFGVVVRRDTKAIAKALLARFGHKLGRVLAAPVSELREVDGVGGNAALHLKAVHAVAVRALYEKAEQRPVLSSWKQLIEYCQVALRHEKAEQFRVLFLDRKNKLMADEVRQRGTVDHAPVYPREVVKRALELGASALILVHNHPSGDPTPSRADIEMTKEVQKAAKALGLEVHDHVIVGGDGNASLRSLGLM